MAPSCVRHRALVIGGMGGRGGMGGIRWPCSRTKRSTSSASWPGSPSGNHFPSRVGRNMDQVPDSFRQRRNTGNRPAARIGITVRQFFLRRTHNWRIFSAHSVFRTMDSSSTDNFTVFIACTGEEVVSVNCTSEHSVWCSLRFGISLVVVHADSGLITRISCHHGSMQTP